MQHPVRGREIGDAVGCVLAKEAWRPDLCPICQETRDQRLNFTPVGDGRSERDAEDVGADHAKA